MTLTMLAGVPVSAYAQQDSKVTMDMQNADIREVLRALFKSVGKSYSVAPEVQGTVTVSLKGVEFETALQNVLKQVNATYRLTAGVYEIVQREEPKPGDDTTGGIEPPAKPNDKIIRRIRVRSADPMVIAMLMANSKTDFSLPPEVSTVIKSRGNGQGGGGGFGNNGYGGGNGSGNNGFGGGNFGGNNYGGNNSGGNNSGGNNYGGNSGGNNSGGNFGGNHRG